MLTLHPFSFYVPVHNICFTLLWFVFKNLLSKTLSIIPLFRNRLALQDLYITYRYQLYMVVLFNNISCKTSNSPILYFPFWEVHISRHLSKTQSTGQIVFIFSFLKKSHLKGNFQHNDLTLFENVNIRAKWAESSRILEICQSWIWKHNLEDQNEQIGWRKISLKPLVKVDH